MWYFVLTLTSILAVFSNSNLNVSAELITSFAGQDDLLEMLNTEKVLIDSLRHYIESQEQKLNILKRKTLEIKSIHVEVGDNRENYLHNPINAVTILKRFTSDWKGLTTFAEDYLNTEDLTQNITKQKEGLIFPTEDDYETALVNLLRIQDMFQLEPQRLSVGEVSGMKLGSEMSWSDCLEIGLKSSKNGYQTYAKYWMETALNKIPNVAQDRNATTTQEQQNETESDVSTKNKKGNNQDDYNVKARIEVLRALLNVEYRGGNLKKALDITNEMLQINPKQKGVIKAKKQIETELKKNKYKLNDKQDKEKVVMSAITKTVEELMIEEICREAINKQQHQQLHTATLEPTGSSSAPSATPHCSLMTGNMKWLLLQPLKVEWLSLDPFIVIYHQTLSDMQLDRLKEFVVEKLEEDSVGDDSMQLTKIGLKKMRQINEKLHYVSGHGREELADNTWHLNRYNFENMMEVNAQAVATVKGQAGVLFNLQQPVLGGSVIFPQLQLSINLPRGSVLYWSTLNEFDAEDYRTNYHLCPVIAGTQLTANTNIKQ